MYRILVLASASLSLGLLASPLAAQQLAEQAVQSTPAPPMPPNPNSRVRWVDVGGPRASQARAKASPEHHATKVKSDRKVAAGSKARTNKKGRTSHASRTASKIHKASNSRAASRQHVREDKPMHFSAKTVRSCHAMTYGQIMRSSSCRAMIKQDLATPAPKAPTKHSKARHQAGAHQKAAAHSKTARSHSTAKRRGR